MTGYVGPYASQTECEADRAPSQPDYLTYPCMYRAVGPQGCPPGWYYFFRMDIS